MDETRLASPNLPEISMIKEFWYLIGWEAKLATTNHKPQILLSLSPCKKSKVLIDSLQTHSWSKNPAIWLHEKHTWPHRFKIGSLRPFLLMFISMQKKSTVSIDSFQKYWWSNNNAIWFVESIFSHNRRTRLFSETHQWIIFFAKARKPYFVWIFGLFPQIDHFSEKFGSVSVLPFKTNFM